jgi:hypothetical protein
MKVVAGLFLYPAGAMTLANGKEVGTSGSNLGEVIRVIVSGP